MDARKFVRKLRGLRRPARRVPVSELPELICQEGSDCDCKGCDKA